MRTFKILILLSLNPNSQDNFYASLPLFKMRLGDLLGQPDSFAPVPENWHVIVTDIIGSTAAVLNGNSQDVNLIATGSIVAVLNITFAQNIETPFFFGGDGATFLVPDCVLENVMQALATYRSNTFSTFGLELRTGHLPVAEVYKLGHEIKVARFKSSRAFVIPVVLGNGLAYAESVIKGESYIFPDKHNPPQPLDLDGMQCRWDRIGPPVNKEEIVTLLVIARVNAPQHEVFREVMQKLDNLYGSHAKRQPISIAQLRLKSTFVRIGKEMRLQIGRVKWLEMLRTWLISLYGRIYFRTKKGRQYLKALVEMSDTLVIDGKINTVISGTLLQRQALGGMLDAMEQEGKLFYGWHISGASIMSCYVRDHRLGHIHFVDGSDGGYTKAAHMMKEKIARSAALLSGGR
ncbi:MAG: DUF3095 domain-containing protein [Sphingobacteriales bacterium]|nr:MAG: DUF3095 domain-containing protein [Sphingobacteriales bacterium]